MMNNSEAVTINLAEIECINFLSRRVVFRAKMQGRIVESKVAIIADCIKMQAIAEEHMSASKRMLESLQNSDPENFEF